MEFLSADEVRARQAEVGQALDRLLHSKALVGKPGSAQWRLLHACFERVLRPETPSDFDGLDKTRAAQLKFEVQDGLRRFYLAHGGSSPMTLTLLHRADLARYRVPDGDSYPDVAAYCLMVREPARDESLPGAGRLVVSFLERVVAEAAEAEFRTYLALPDLRPDLLAPWLTEGGPASSQVLARATLRRSQGWVLGNPMNPSTHRVLSVRVRRVGDDVSTISSLQYWHLRWWCPRLRDYVYAFRETSRQTHVLKRLGEDWKLDQTSRPDQKA